MRTATRLLTGTALTAAAACLVTGPATAAAAGDADPVTALRISPATVTPGADVTVDTLACGAGGRAAGDASAVGAGAFTLAPAAREKSAPVARAESAVGRFTVPAEASPGTYAIRAKCADGQEAAGDLVVSLTASRQQVHPTGHMKTGVGGALGSDPVQTAAGVAALALAAAGGTWLLHRRASGDGI